MPVLVSLRPHMIATCSNADDVFQNRSGRQLNCLNKVEVPGRLLRTSDEREKANEKDELDEGEFGGINLELEGDFPLRQFINLTDDEGEEGFIPIDQIIAMEVMKEAVFPDVATDPDQFISSLSRRQLVDLAKKLRPLCTCL